MGARPLPAHPLAALVASAAVALGALAGAATADARDPGRWRLATVSTIPAGYNQGVTTTASGAFTFSSTSGLFRTTKTLRETRSEGVVLPPEVQSSEGYDHIGDLTYDRGEGGRLLLPLECYRLGAPNFGNHCGTGSIGVADPSTLRWRYYVKLDPIDIKKAMWAEVSPDRRWLWTSDGRDLLRYDLRQVAFAGAAPAGPMLRPARRLRGAVPPTGITGAVFVGKRLFLAGYTTSIMQVWSVDTRTGSRRLEIERRIRGESEGLTRGRALGGTLHWMIAPFDPLGRPPTYGPDRGALLTFTPRVKA